MAGLFTGEVGGRLQGSDRAESRNGVQRYGLLGGWGKAERKRRGRREKEGGQKNAKEEGGKEKVMEEGGKEKVREEEGKEVREE